MLKISYLLLLTIVISNHSCSETKNSLIFLSYPPMQTNEEVSQFIPSFFQTIGAPKDLVTRIRSCKAKSLDLLVSDLLYKKVTDPKEIFERLFTILNSEEILQCVSTVTESMEFITSLFELGDDGINFVKILARYYGLTSFINEKFEKLSGSVKIGAFSEAGKLCGEMFLAVVTSKPVVEKEEEFVKCIKNNRNDLEKLENYFENFMIMILMRNYDAASENFKILVSEVGLLKSKC